VNGEFCSGEAQEGHEKIEGCLIMVVLGIDAGASKTHAVLATEEGNVVGVGRAGSANWEVVGLDGAKDALQVAINQTIDAAGITAGDIVAAGYGLAGLDWPSDEERLRHVIDALGIDSPYLIVNDAFLPLRAGTVGGIGLAAIAGSGATVVGRNSAGKTERSLGAGYPFTDWGGAGDISIAAVHAVAQSYMDMGPDTVLTERLLAMTGCTDLAEMLERIMRWQVVVSGEFAIQVFQAAHEGDAVAKSIVRRVGETIGANAVTVARRLEMLDTAFDLVTAGGVFSSQSDLLNKGLLETVRDKAPKANLIYWQSPPVVGALLLALDLLNLGSLPDTELLAARIEKSLARSKS